MKMQRSPWITQTVSTLEGKLRRNNVIFRIPTPVFGAGPNSREAASRTLEFLAFSLIHASGIPREQPASQSE